MWYNAGMGKLVELNDGLRLVVCENPAVRSVSAGIFVAAGAVNETPEEAGISPFIEHMGFKSTPRPSGFGLSLFHISEPTRRAPISYSVFFL